MKVGKKKQFQTAAVVVLCLRGASHSYFIEYIELNPGLLSGTPMKQRVQAQLDGKRERSQYITQATAHYSVMASSSIKKKKSTIFVFSGFATIKSTDLHINPIQSNSALLYGHSGPALAFVVSEPKQV